MGKDARLDGLGLHSGVRVSVSIRPSEDGIVFRCGTEVVRAVPENVSDTTRCTRLGGISTVEHLMSAFAGLEITDADVELTAPELPALDGSAHGFVSALQAAGASDLGEAAVPRPFSRVFVREEGFTLGVGAGEGHWKYVFEAPDRWIGRQEFETSDVVGDYIKGIAPARTFGFEDEVETVLAAGLGKGLGAEQVLLIGGAGYVGEPRFPEEPARHKLLDAIADIYLAGVPIRFLNVSAERTGHRANVRAAQMLWEAVMAAAK